MYPNLPYITLRDEKRDGLQLPHAHTAVPPPPHRQIINTPMHGSRQGDIVSSS